MAIVSYSVSPTTAQIGSIVKLKVTVTQKTGEPWYVAVSHAKVDPPNEQVWLVPEWVYAESGKSYTFEGTFVMPTSNTRLRFNILVYKSGMSGWEKDQTVALTIGVSHGNGNGNGNGNGFDYPTFNVEGQGQIMPEFGPYIQGQSLTVFCIPNSGWRFHQFKRNGIAQTKENPHTFSGLKSAETFTAVFVSDINTYWLTLAKGNTEEEFASDIPTGSHLIGRHRLVLKTNVPNNVLRAVAWAAGFANSALRYIFSKQGLTFEQLEVSGSDLRFYYHASPHPAVVLIPLIAAVIYKVLSILGVVWIGSKILNLLNEKEITEQTKNELEKAKTEAEVIKIITPPTVYECIKCGYKSMVIFDVCPECDSTSIIPTGGIGAADPSVALGILEAWFKKYDTKTDKESTDWEKYLIYGLIGAGVIAGTAILLPVIIDATRKRQ